jgi:LPPG:FO 2-phospho-L-lactate transferase
VSIGTLLTVPQIRDAVKQSSAPVVGVSPIINGHVVRGMADRLLPAVNIDVSAAGVAGLYEGLIDGWVIDTADAALADAIAATGVATIATDTVMDTPTRAAALATRCLELADYVSGQSA